MTPFWLFKCLALTSLITAVLFLFWRLQMLSLQRPFNFNWPINGVFYCVLQAFTTGFCHSLSLAHWALWLLGLACCCQIQRTANSPTWSAKPNLSEGMWLWVNKWTNCCINVKFLIFLCFFSTVKLLLSKRKSCIKQWDASEGVMEKPIAPSAGWRSHAISDQRIL